MAQPPENLCVLRLSAIGDVCHTLPIVQTIRQAWPQTRITWIIGKPEFSLIGDVPGIEFIVLDKQQGNAGMQALRFRLRHRKFAVLLHMQASMRANRICRWIQAPLKLGFDKKRARDWQWLFTNKKIPFCDRQHVMDGLFGFAETLGIKERNLCWDIPIPEEAKLFVRQTLKGHQPVLVISPCSSQRFRNWRNWSVENYAKVAQHAIRTFNAQVVITGGSSTVEQEYAQNIVKKVSLMQQDAEQKNEKTAPTKILNLIGKTNLKQLLALIQRADVVLCPDSGPAHISTAVGTSVIGLYASSNPKRTGPYASQNYVIDKYPEALLQESGKDLERVRWGLRVRSPEAMSKIRVEEVLTKLNLLLKK